MILDPVPFSPSIDAGWSAEFDTVTSEQWTAHLSEFEDANFYQTWAYGEISWGRSQLSHCLLKRSGQLMAMAQLRVLRLPLLPCGVAYVRWGPLWRRKGAAPDPDVLHQALQALTNEYVRHRKFLLRLLPNAFADGSLEPLMKQAFAGCGLRPSTAAPSYRTFLLDLSPPLEVLRKNLDQKWRNQLNRSEKNGLELLEGTDQELYSAFLGLYQEMMERKKFDTTVDPVQFARIQRLLPESQKMLTLLAVKDGRPVSALVGSTVGDTGIYLLGATSNEGLQHKGAYLLQWRMIQRLKERGCGYYDLGGINPRKNPGVFHFKQGLAGMDTTRHATLQVCETVLSSLITGAADISQRWLRRNSRA